MAGVFADGILCQLLGAELASNAPWKMHLYTNNFTPIPTMTIGSFTEAMFSGYAAQNLSYGACSVAADKATQIATALVFTATGVTPGQNVYGYFITDNVGNLVSAELLAGGPFNMSILGAMLTVTDTKTLKSA